MSEYRFPYFCQSANGRSYYKISSATHMTEIQLIGSRYALHELEVRILPERLLLQDMLEDDGTRYLPLRQEEYEARLEDCKNNRERIG